MIKEKNQEYLSKHKYKIFQDKDGRWKTTLLDETKSNGRRLIAKKNKEDLEQAIIDFYMDLEQKENNPISRLSKYTTLEELYPIWLDSRILESKNMRTAKRNHQDWNRYYKNTPITKVPMSNLSVNELKDWAHKLIDDNQLNKRQYYNITLIIKKCFEYASDEGLCENTWEKAKGKVNTKKLKKVNRPESSTQVYFKDEEDELIKYTLKMFTERPWNIGILTLPFIFYTGMRIGEVVALRYDDLSENEIYVRCGEVNDFCYDKESKTFKYVGKKVENHVKTEAGTRIIPYTDSAKKIIELVERSSSYYEYYDNGYIFCPASKRMVSNTIGHSITRYCNKLGIPEKSAHKIRKTYISQAINNGIDLDTVCRVAGHVDLKTTLQSYLFSLDRKDDVYKKFNDIFKSVI